MSNIPIKKTVLLAIILVPVLLFPGGKAYPREAGEAARIEYLIKSVGDLQGVRFVRNGSEYDPLQAASHLRFKLEKAGSRVNSVEDFIVLVGSKSYHSGKPYRLRYPDGTIMDAEKFFRRRLQDFNSGHKK